MQPSSEQPPESWFRTFRMKPLGVTVSEHLSTIVKMLERIGMVIAELGYDALLEDVFSSDLVGGNSSLLGSDEVTVVPGDQQDATKPILLALTKGCTGSGALSFPRVMQQVKTRLIEGEGMIKVVVICCDSWDSTSFQESHSEELSAHHRKGVEFLLLLVGVPNQVLIPIPVRFDLGPT